MRRLVDFYQYDALPIIAKQFPPPNEALQEKAKQIFLYSLWFHDAIYDPKSKENEVKSIEVFEEFAATNTDLETSSKEIVSQIILSTVSH